ncbi:hypothetical protein SynRS9915_01182 [Synechococcus sp. RS9915]|nr:hypothetical protein SynRS9915_01182 [Synechococcus sp. RS9915]
MLEDRFMQVSMIYVHISRHVLTVLSGLLIVVTLSSCTLRNEPPRAIVIEALQSQIQTTQVSIAQSLDLQPVASAPAVSRVRVDHQDVLKVEGERFVHLKGSFDWQLPRDSVRVDSAFDLYLQRGSHGEGWSLARPAASNGGKAQRWLLYPLGLPTS